MWTKGRRSKNPKILRTSYLEAPLDTVRVRRKALRRKKAPFVCGGASKVGGDCGRPEEGRAECMWRDSRSGASIEAATVWEEEGQTPPHLRMHLNYTTPVCYFVCSIPSKKNNKVIRSHKGEVHKKQEMRFRYRLYTCHFISCTSQ